MISAVQPLDFVVGVALESVQADPLTLLFWAFAMFQAVVIPFRAMGGPVQPAPAQPA